MTVFINFVYLICYDLRYFCEDTKFYLAGGNVRYRIFHGLISVYGNDLV